MTPASVGLAAGGSNSAAGGHGLDGTGAAASPGIADLSVEEPRARATRPSGRASPAIGSAREASLQRWLAYVWPAIALDGGPTGQSWVTLAAAGDLLLRPAMAGIAPFVAAVQAAAQAAAGGAALTGGPAVDGRSSGLPEAPAPASGGGLAYFVILAVLLAVLAYTVWTEFRSVLRTHLH